MGRIPITAAGLAIALAIGAEAFAQDAKGAKVFVDNKCAVCHSIAGKGNPKGALDGVGSKLSAEEIKVWITDPVKMAEKAKATRKPPMKAFSTLAAADLDALVAYLHSLKKK